MSKIGNTLKETQAALNVLLGFDYDTLKCTSIFEQNSADAFSKLTPKEAKQLVMKILQLNKFDKYEKICREKTSLFSNTLFNINKEIDVTESFIEEVEDDTPLKVREKEIQNEQTKLKEKYYEYDIKYRNQIQIQSKLANLQTGLEKFMQLNKCPTCLQMINPEHKDKIKKRFEDTINETKKLVKDENIKLNMNECQSQSRKLQFELGELQNKIREIKNKKQKQVKVRNQKEFLQQQIKQVEKDISTYKILTTAFGRNGIPSHIIENTIPEIEQIVNDLLISLDIDMEIELRVKKETKSKTISDTLDINISKDCILRPYSNYSGGEKFIIDLVIRTALSVILLRRKGHSNATLAIDEGMGSLDSSNKDKFIKFLNIISSKFSFKKILVITHIEELMDSLPNKIIVRKRNKSTYLSYNNNKEK